MKEVNLEWNPDGRNQLIVLGIDAQKLLRSPFLKIKAIEFT